MNVVVLRRVMVGLSVLGVALAAYLTYVHYAGIKPACTAGQSCVKVQTSQWSRLDGVPVALIGLIGYVLILGSLLVRDSEESRLATLGLTLVGFAFSAYLTYRELYSIHAVCEECATSAVFLTLLFLGAVTLYLSGPAIPRPATGAPGPAGESDGAPEPAAQAAASATLGADG
ncbi:MAG: vitamin K epoxide reductase family protein [Actinomycetota bacterium]|nr:vitamin K epoxide reductase family protein [Actinomycetota bacterium]